MTSPADQRDGETGLDYFGARYFSAAQGRFTSPDTAADEILSVPLPYADLKNPQTLNLYAYAGNNPLRYVDLDGHDFHVCVDNGNGGQNCFDATKEQYDNLYNQQNGQNGVAMPVYNGPGSGGAITCGGAVCGSATYFEPGGSMGRDTFDLGLGIVAGKAAEPLFGKVFNWLGGLFGRAATETASQGAAKVLLSGGGKQAAKDIVEGLAEGAQKASAKRAIAAATKSETISISQAADGTLTVARTRPGFNGWQTFTKTIDSAGNSSTVQTAYDASGNLVHYDPRH